jgi:hypothetical protein
MCVKRNLCIGLVALSLLSGTVLAQAPPVPQVGAGEAGQFKAQTFPASDRPAKPVENSSGGTGMWIIIGLVVLAIIIWLASAKPKERPVPGPIPIIPIPGYRKPTNNSGAVWFWIGLGLLALVIYGCVSDKPKPVAPPPQIQPLQPLQPVQPGQWQTNK